MAYEIEFRPEALKHYKSFSTYQKGIIRDAIDEQLVHTPGEETRNRVKLRENPLAEWELRIGDIRVFYTITEAEKKVIVMAIGEKEHERLVIDGKVYRL